MAASIGSTTGQEATGTRAARGARLPYLPALDGLRALAVLAVILYHAGARWLPGGFLGVEIFFVISGYLITSLLLSEWQASGRIDFKDFWLRRARRLLPALFVLLLAVLAYAVLFLPDEVAGLRRDAAASAGYITNWYLVLTNKSYFEAVGRPSLLRHLWSLAVEEQFYVLWPLLFAGVVTWLRPHRAVWAVLGGAVASAVLMAVLFNPDVDPSRVYYGTDTRAAGLLLGAALAFVWAPGRDHLPGLLARAGRAGKAAPDALGLAGLAVLVWANAAITEYQPFLYRGGFFVVALATVAVIAAVVHPRARLLPAVLGWAPLRWAGVRSYGLYLWHWPIMMITRPQLDVPLSGLPLVALQLAATGVLVELSYRFVETPVRQGALGRAWHSWREAGGASPRRVRVRWATGVLAFAVCFAALGESVVRAQPPAVPSYLSVESVQFSAADSTGPVSGPAGMGEQSPALDPLLFAGPAYGGEYDPAGAEQTGFAPLWLIELLGVQAGSEATADVGPATATVVSSRDEVLDDTQYPNHGRGVELPTATVVPTAAATAIPTPKPVATQPVTTTAAAQAPLQAPGQQGIHVTAIGDSVMIGAAPLLQKQIPGLDLDAKVGRQAAAAIDLLRQRRDAGTLGEVVVIHIANNGTISVKQFDQMMGLLSGVRRVVIVNVKVPRTWESADNSVLADGVTRYANAVLVDWHGASADQPGYFYSDGIHLRPEGARAYAALISNAVLAP